MIIPFNFKVKLFNSHPLPINSPSLAECPKVRLSPDNKIFILYQGKLIHTDCLSPQNKKTRLERKFEEFLNRRELRERSKKLTSLLSNNIKAQKG
jgi:hypothetical protein